MALLLSEAAIISTMMEALLFGFSLLMAILTLWILLQNRRERRPNYPLIVSSVVLEVLALAELIDNIARVWQGLVTVGPFLEGGPEFYYLDVTHHTFVIKGCLYNTQTLILDGVVIYRTYVVWQSVYAVILPVLGWLALLAASIGGNVSLATEELNITDVFAGAVGKWITAIYALTLGTNLSASLLLAYRIWSVNHDALRFKTGNRLTPVLRAVIESGAIYSATITVALILFVINSIGVYVVLDMISPIICIVFNMIIIRVAFAANRVPSALGSSGRQQNTTIDRPTGHTSRHGGGRQQVRAYGSDGHELKSLAVEITRYIETDADTASTAEADRDRKYANRLDEAEEGIPSNSKTSSGIAV